MFGDSRWFTRGWTLQELLAPQFIEVFSVEGHTLGTKSSLMPQIMKITGISESALLGASMSAFGTQQRMEWARKRVTKRGEDAAYALLGIFNVHMPLIYGEGKENAMKRLRKEIEEPSTKLLELRP